MSQDKSDQWTAEDVSAMANVKKVYDFYYSMFQRISVNNASSKKKGKKIKVRFSGKKDNLWWKKGNIIEIGTGTGTDSSKKGFCYKKEELAAAKDVLCHEFTHGVVADETDLEENGFGYAGAINEAYADTAACFLDGNWMIGEDITGVFNGQNLPIRDIANPENVQCPSSYGGLHFMDVAKLMEGDEEKYDNGGVHTNCTIITHAFYLMNQAGMKKADLMKIWYDSLMQGYQRDANFYDVRLHFIEAWDALKGTDKKKEAWRQDFGGIPKEKYMNIIEHAFDQVKVTETNCDLAYMEYEYLADRERYTAGYFCDEISLQGKICQVDEDGKMGNNPPLSDAEITVFDAESMEELDDTVSDENGRYELYPDYCEEYVVKIQREGYLSETMYVHHVNPVVQQEYFCDVVELIPESYDGYGRADGWIFDATNKAPVEGVRLKWRKGINSYDSKVVEDIETYEDGDYYSGRLPAGNYCVEVIADKLGYINTYFNVKVIGGTYIDYQYGYISPKIAEGQIRTVLSWGELPLDIDSHMNYQLSDGTVGHVYFRNREAMSGEQKICALDRDDITSFGPETTTIYDGIAGIYDFSVKNYSRECDMGLQGGVVRVYLGGHAYPGYTFCMPEDAVDLWEVFRYNSATGYLQPKNAV